jgi:hypothetical protein
MCRTCGGFGWTGDVLRRTICRFGQSWIFRPGRPGRAGGLRREYLGQDEMQAGLTWRVVKALIRLGFGGIR